MLRVPGDIIESGSKFVCFKCDAGRKFFSFTIMALLEIEKRDMPLIISEQLSMRAVRTSHPERGRGTRSGDVAPGARTPHPERGRRIRSEDVSPGAMFDVHAEVGRCGACARSSTAPRARSIYMYRLVTVV